MIDMFHEQSVSNLRVHTINVQTYLETERMCVQSNGGRGGVGVRVYTINAQTELETERMCVQGNGRGGGGTCLHHKTLKHT